MTENASELSDHGKLRTKSTRISWYKCGHALLAVAAVVYVSDSAVASYA